MSETQSTEGRSFWSNIFTSAAAATAGAATTAATGATGAVAALLGFGSPGIVGGTVASTAMSTAWTTGIGTGLISAAQSAGALFMNAVGGSTLAAVASTTAPVAAAVAAGYAIYSYQNSPSSVDSSQSVDVNS